jgi:hypothetical protein
MFIVGYPLDYESLCEMFDVTSDEVDSRIKKYGFELYYSDKGQNILGLKVPESDYPFHDFLNVDKLVILMLETKSKFLKLFKKTGVDITKFRFYPMESEHVDSTEEPCIFSL